MGKDILNADFRGGWTRKTHTGQEFGEIFVPEFWTAWWEDGPVPWDPSNPEGLGRPEMHVIEHVAPFLDPMRVYPDDQSVKLFTYFRAHRGGLYQTFSPGKGKVVTARFNAHAWASIDHDPFTSNSDGDGWDQVTYLVGIDPTGGTDPWSDTVVWSEAAHIYDEFDWTPKVQVVAEQDDVTVFVKSVMKWPYEHCDSYISEVDVVVEEPAEDPEEPEEPGEGCPQFDYAVHINLLPQTLTFAELTGAEALYFDNRETWVHSHDDAREMAKRGADDSWVRVWNPERWNFNVVEHLLENGITVEVTYFEGTEPELDEDPDDPEEPEEPDQEYSGPIVKKGSLLSIHSSGGDGALGFLDMCAEQGCLPSSIKILACSVDNLIGLAEMKAKYPGVLFVVRFMDLPGVDNIEGPNLDELEASANEIYEALLPVWALYGEYIDYVEIVNEQNDEVYRQQRLAALYRQIMVRIREDGSDIKLLLFSYSVGVPKNSNYDEDDQLGAIFTESDVIQMAHEDGHGVSLHEYDDTAWKGTSTGRFPAWIEWMQKTGWYCPIFITEYAVNASGFQNMAHDEIIAINADYDQHCREYIEVVGIHLFNVGMGWDNMDYAPMMSKIVTYMASEKDVVNWAFDDDPIPEPEPEPEQEPETVSLVGVHGEAWCEPPVDVDKTIANMKRLEIKWVKVLAKGTGMVDCCRRLVEEGFRVVVRFYEERQFPGRNPNVQFTAAYVAVGVLDFEICNEPNLPVEWKEGTDPTWRNPDLLELAAESWWLDAMAVISAGGKAAFPAMAPTDRGGVNSQYSGVKWFLGFLNWLEEHHGIEAGVYFQTGDLWLAVHISPYNKPFDQTFMASWGYDDQTLLWYERLQQFIYEVFGWVPVTISTEGGVFSPEHLRDLFWEPDYDESTWGQRVWAMYEFLEARRQTHPPGLTAMMSWLFEDGRNGEWHGCGWYDASGNARSPVTEVLTWK